MCLHHISSPLRRGNRRFDGDELAADAQDDRPANFDVNVRGVRVNRRLEYPRKNFHARAIKPAGKSQQQKKNRSNVPAPASETLVNTSETL